MPIVSVRPREAWLVMGFNVSHLTDAHTVQRATLEVQAALGRLPLRGAVAVSFEGVENVTTQVSTMLRQAKQTVDDRLGRIVLCRVGDRMHELLRLTGLSGEFEVFARLRDVLGEPSRAAFAMAGPPVTKSSRQHEPEWID